MDNLLLFILVIIFVFMCSGMMKQMCGGRLVEGLDDWDGLNCTCSFDWHCQRGLKCSDSKCVVDNNYDPWDGGAGGWWDRKTEDATRKGRSPARDCLW